MCDYPKKISQYGWIIQIKAKNGQYEELYIDLIPDRLYQMGWYSELDINIHNILEYGNDNL